MSNVKNIATGFKNLVIRDEGVEKLADYRKEICDKCEFKSKNKPYTCTICGCLLAAKNRSPSEKCPKNKW